MPVRKVQLGRRGFRDLTLCGEVPHRLQHVLHLAAVGTGVHVNGTAHRAGDAVGKFQAGQTMFQRSSAQSRKLLPCPRRHLHGVRKTEFRFQGGGVDHRAAVALVGKEDVAAVAQQIIPDGLCFAQRHRCAELCFAFRQDEHIRRAANFKGAVCRKGLVLLERDACRCQLLLESFHNGLLLFRGNQSILSSRPRRMSSSRAAL